MTLEADLFWSFRSPYSYLATPQYRRMTEDYDLKINVRPVYPIAIRTPEFFKSVNPKWIPYLMLDCKRIADYRGMGFKWPNPDPVVIDRTNGTIAKEQPYIRMITRLGMKAVEAGKGLSFIDEVSRSIFDGSTTNWHLPETLEKTVARAGLSLTELTQQVEGNEDKIDVDISRNQEALDDSGHWGVPTLVFNGEPFFGQDRVDLALWRMKQHGLTARKN
ncbi:2-hydroxychromene-2-carboxylate isomerase [Sneathiella limimaris]|uniref:2-hydroxychromene-2-carboxylate isomerase n=1 Tax=Sneathiella limimaris TaxID=1964213 RepID=UPI00146F85BA|nr:DsbA family protein [Sneathiella limimaris]